MSNPFPPLVPLPDDDEPRRDDEVPTREVDGRETLDPDIDDALIDSAEADRIAATEDDDDLDDDDLLDDEDDDLLDERDDDVDDDEFDDDLLDDDDR